MSASLTMRSHSTKIIDSTSAPGLRPAEAGVASLTRPLSSRSTAISGCTIQWAVRPLRLTAMVTESTRNGMSAMHDLDRGVVAHKTVFGQGGVEHPDLLELRRAHRFQQAPVGVGDGKQRGRTPVFDLAGVGVGEIGWHEWGQSRGFVATVRLRVLDEIGQGVGGHGGCLVGPAFGGGRVVFRATQWAGPPRGGHFGSVAPPGCVLSALWD